MEEKEPQIVKQNTREQLVALEKICMYDLQITYPYYDLHSQHLLHSGTQQIHNLDADWSLCPSEHRH